MAKQRQTIKVKYRLKDGSIVERTHVVLGKGEELSEDPVKIAEEFIATTTTEPEIEFTEDDDDDSDD